MGELYPGSTAVAHTTGRAALVSALRLAMRATGRHGVVLPAYTSFSVAAAAAAADADVWPCDLDPRTLDFDADDLRRCVDGRIAAVVLGNPFGFPSSSSMVEWLRQHGIIVIDDAAQALGAMASGERVGARGDLGILSFGRGKCVTTGAGGVLVVHSPHLRRLLVPVAATRDRGVGTWLRAATVGASRNPLVFDLLSRIPGSAIGQSVFDPAIVIRGPAATVHGLASRLPTDVQRLLDVRRRVASAWQEALGPLALRGPQVPAEASPAFLRFPVFARDRADREARVVRLRRVGLRYVKAYPSTLSRIPGFSGWCQRRLVPGAEEIAATLIALPCHERVGRDEIRRAAAALEDPGQRRLPEPRPALHAFRAPLQ